MFISMRLIAFAICCSGGLRPPKVWRKSTPADSSCGEFATCAAQLPKLRHIVIDANLPAPSRSAISRAPRRLRAAANIRSLLFEFSPLFRRQFLKTSVVANWNPDRIESQQRRSNHTRTEQIAGLTASFLCRTRITRTATKLRCSGGSMTAVGSGVRRFRRSQSAATTPFV
jgi:hypothetical protein